MQKTLVWDWPVRIGHWLMVAGFVLAWLTSESEGLRMVHAVAGATVVSVASFRVFWGLFGSRTARFSDFVCGPRAVRDYLLSLLRLQPARFIGHNPAGGWAILLLLGLALLAGASGWGIYNEHGGHWLEELHEGLAASMLLMVIVHLAGVISGSMLHGENLVRSMISGYKVGACNHAIPSSRPLAGILMLAWSIAAVWWLLR